VENEALDIASRTIHVTIILCLPVLLTALVVGLAVSVLQAVTQVNEMTLTFVPKLLMVGIVLLVLMPWMLAVMGDFCHEVIGMLGQAPRGPGG
jgi:flagellar biosynthetic protein FliQ